MQGARSDSRSLTIEVAVIDYRKLMCSRPPHRTQSIPCELGWTRRAQLHYLASALHSARCSPGIQAAKKHLQHLSHSSKHESHSEPDLNAFTTTHATANVPDHLFGTIRDNVRRSNFRISPPSVGNRPAAHPPQPCADRPSAVQGREGSYSWASCSRLSSAPMPERGTP